MRRKLWIFAPICVALCTLLACAGAHTARYDATYTIAVGTSSAWNPFPGARGVVYTDATGQIVVPVTPQRADLGPAQALIEGTAVRIVGMADGTVELIATLDGQRRTALVTVGTGGAPAGPQAP